jgi:hypothetical protein
LDDRISLVVARTSPGPATRRVREQQGHPPGAASVRPGASRKDSQGLDVPFHDRHHEGRGVDAYEKLSPNPAVSSMTGWHRMNT